MVENSAQLQGLFLGKRLPLEALEVSIKFFLPFNDLLNNLFIVSDTGTGKTNLFKDIIEEAAMKNMPTIAIDLKGDISSLGLFFDKVSSEQLQVLVKEVKHVKDEGQRARQEYEYHIKQLSRYGLTSDHIKYLKDNIEVAIFTPRSEQGIPLAVSSLINPPENIKEIIDKQKDVLVSMIETFSSLLFGRIYQSEDISKKTKELKLVKEVVLYCWLNGIDLESLSGMARFIEMLDAPPFEKIEGVNLKEFITEEAKTELVHKLNEFLFSVEQLWYDGVPIDVNILCSKTSRSEKTRICIINVSELDNPKERNFVIARTIYAIYKWMSSKPKVSHPALLFGIDEVCGDEMNSFCGVKSSAHIKLLMTELFKSGKNHGVASLIGTRNPQNADVQVVKHCGLWAIGYFFASDTRDDALILIDKAGIPYRNIGSLIAFPRKGEFLFNLSSGEVALVDKRWSITYHEILPVQVIPKILTQEVKINFKTFYVLDKVHSQTVALAKSIQGKPAVLIPDALYESFSFGVGAKDPFVMEIEPEEAIRLCLKELAKEGIGADEILFRNAQLTVARGHRGDWKVDTLIRDLAGRVVDHIKDEGVYSRCDSMVKLDRLTKEKVIELVKKDVNPRCQQIAQKVAVVAPEIYNLAPMEAKNQIGRDLSVHPKEVKVIIKEKTVALFWKFTIEYRTKIIECIIDMILNSTQMDYPEFSLQEALAEVKKNNPDLPLTQDHVTARAFIYVVHYSTAEYNYEYRVSKNSGKIVKQKVFITKEKAQNIANARAKKTPHAVWFINDNWNFYYLDGLKLLVDETTEDITQRNMISDKEAEDTARDLMQELTSDSEFEVKSKHFFEGVWFIKFSSKKWEADFEVDESGKALHTIRMQKDYCLNLARKVLDVERVPVTLLERFAPIGEGWEFDFISPLGYFTVLVDGRCREIIKKRLTIEGIKHFAFLEIQGDVAAIFDREEFWDIIVTNKTGRFCVSIHKQEGRVLKVKKKKFFFWKEIKRVKE